MEVDQKTITNWNDDFRKSCLEKDFLKSSNFKPPIYNAWNTQESIAEEVGVTHQSVSNIIDSAKNYTCGEFCKTFEPMLYATWKQLKQDNGENFTAENVAKKAKIGDISAAET